MRKIDWWLHRVLWQLFLVVPISWRLHWRLLPFAGAYAHAERFSGYRAALSTSDQTKEPHVGATHRGKFDV